MKSTHRCPKCKHDRILYISQVADRYGQITTSDDTSSPMKIAHYVKTGQVLGFATTTTERAGELEAGVCPACGYTELYTRDPQHIVVDNVNVHLLVAKS